MKYAIYEEIDGYEIVKGFDTPGIDKPATDKVIQPMVKELPEMKAVESKQKLINEKAEALAAARAVLRTGVTGVSREKALADGSKAESELQALRDGLRTALENLSRRTDELFRDNAVYFLPGRREKQVDNVDDLWLIHLSRGPNQQVTTAGETVPDFRGFKGWLKVADRWQEHNIEQLGIKPADTAKADKDLSDSEKNEIAEQKESERVAKLSATEKQSEKQSRIDSARAQAATMKTELEIENRTDALESAQEWYAMQVADIEKKYA